MRYFLALFTIINAIMQILFYLSEIVLRCKKFFEFLFPTSRSKEYLKTPSVSFNKLIYEDSVIASIKQFIENYNKSFASKNILFLHGEPGTGKTSIAEAIANELKVKYFYSVACTTLLRSVIGQTETEIRALFSDAIKHNQDVVIFLDEVDSLIHINAASIIHQINLEIENLKKYPRILLILATNSPDKFEQHFKRRLQDHGSMIEIGPLGPKKRVELIQQQVASYLLLNRFHRTITDLSNHAEALQVITEGLTPSMICVIAKNACEPSSTSHSLIDRIIEAADDYKKQLHTSTQNHLEKKSSYESIKPCLQLNNLVLEEDFLKNLKEFLDDFQSEPQSKVLMMFGHPGTGKTSLAEAIATELKASFFYPISGFELVSSWSGETEKNIAAFIQHGLNIAEQKQSVVLFIDEIDSLISSHTSTASLHAFNKQLALLTKTNQPKLLLITATNNPQLIRESCERRIKKVGAVISVPLLSPEKRISFIERITNQLFEQNNLHFSDDQRKQLAHATDGLSPSILEDLTKQTFKELSKNETIAQDCFFTTLLSQIDQYRQISVQASHGYDGVVNPKLRPYRQDNPFDFSHLLAPAAVSNLLQFLIRQSDIPTPTSTAKKSHARSGYQAYKKKFFRKYG